MNVTVGINLITAVCSCILRWCLSMETKVDAVERGLYGYFCGFRGNDIGILQRAECVHSYFPGHDASVCTVAVKW